MPFPGGSGCLGAVSRKGLRGARTDGGSGCLGPGGGITGVSRIGLLGGRTLGGSGCFGTGGSGCLGTGGSGFPLVGLDARTPEDSSSFEVEVPVWRFEVLTPSTSPTRLLFRIRSTTLSPKTPKARCATVSPTADAITALTASCVSGLSPAAAFAWRSKVATRERSWALRIRSSCINVSEKESRICFGVIETRLPACACEEQTRFGTALQGKRIRRYTERPLIAKEILRCRIRNRTLIGSPSHQPSTETPSCRRCNPTPAPPSAPDAASCRQHFLRDCKCPRYFPTNHSD